jgi:hypothetical protein
LFYFFFCYVLGYAVNRLLFIKGGNEIFCLYNAALVA